ncbi:U-box domain-containing protein 4 [Ananas comosus]|uniref:RING-type E3 ubiquitin transferase n=1 Tax=Ananas comosus TaxID=4615 RepID=A0A199VXF0_ANACO|nr:U-box domain-containing protein 4 [Ananas comosus]
MSSPFDFLSHQRRRSPLGGAYFAPADLGGAALIGTLSAAARSLVASYLAAAAAAAPPLQRRNARSLVRKVSVMLVLFDFLSESYGASSSSSSPFPRGSPDSATLCLRELYIFLYRARMLLDYCSQSARLWVVVRNNQISGYFRDLDQEIATLLDVLPLGALRLSADVREQLELLRRQCHDSDLRADPRGEELRRSIFSLLDEFARGDAPDPDDLRSLFVDQLGVRDADACRSEIEFLEEQILNSEEDTDLPLLGGAVALARYCRFLLFGFGEPKIKPSGDDSVKLKTTTRLLSSGGDSSFAIPKDLCCPISLDLMRDPVVVSTGQTYDRASIIQWMDEGHYTCPNSGQILTHTRLVPNRALRSLIAQWCAAYGIPYESHDGTEGSAESIAAACSSKASIEMNRLTSRMLVRQLFDGTDELKAIAAREIRLLAKTGRENRASIAELGAIPPLCRLLRSPNSVAQENAVTALLNLSIYDVNKSRIIEEEGCLNLIVYVLKNGWTVEARENAAATLFSLSVVHEYKKRIVEEPGAVESLANLLKEGTTRGRKDAVMALFNLSTHPECWVGLLEFGAVTVLAGALENELVAEEAAGALALLLKQQRVAKAVVSVDRSVTSLVGLMRRGSPKGKENAVAALHELCRRGGSMMIRRVARMPGFCGLLQNIFLTGTKRAKRKAALLTKMCQKCEAPTMMLLGSSWVIDQTLARNSSLRRVSSFESGELTVSTAISVPVP